MAMTLQECIDKIKKEYPNHYPYAFVEVEGKYAFNLIQKGHDPKSAISDMHIVDPETGYVSGGISIMEFLKNAQFRNAWKKANLVANHDESIGHSSVSRNGWGVRRNQNGRNDRPFGLAASERNNDLVYGGSLCHYGIKGQSWGVRNGPPYPLDQKTHNKVVKGEGKSKVGASSGNDGKTGLIPELVVLASFIGLRAYLNSPKVQDKIQAKNQQKFNNKNEALSKDLIGDIADVGEKYTADHMPRQIQGEHSVEDDMAACNPRYNNGVVPGTSTNCTLCAFTYDLRRRGMDVTALSSETGNYPEQIIKSLYKDAKADKMTARSFTDLYEQAEKKYPEGARGEISVYGLFMGHSMAWEIHNGKLEVLDTQRNVKVSPRDLMELGFDPSFKQTAFVRTDHLEVNPEGINLVSAQLKPDWKQTIQAERNKSDSAKVTPIREESKAAAGIKKLSESERRKNYEELYLKQHPNADPNSKAVKNWVNSQMNG